MLRIDVGYLLSAAASAVLVLGGLAAGVAWFRKWIRSVAADSREAAVQLRTRNGTTVAQYAESTAQDIAQIRTDMGALQSLAASNRDLAVGAYAIAAATAERLDKHLIHHAQPEV